MEIDSINKDAIIYRVEHNHREKLHYKKEDIKNELSCKNSSLITRGTAKETTQYMRDLIKEENIFRYNRKNLVHAIEYVVQLPADIQPEQEALFYETCVNYIASLNPLGRRAILAADVHRDEFKRLKEFAGYDDKGNKLYKEGKRISKDHIHILAMPVVVDNKHPEHPYKLRGKTYNERKMIKQYHPQLQKAMDDANVKCTVYNPSNSGKKIALFAAELKRFTDVTNKVIDKSMSREQLVNILIENEELRYIKIKHEKEIERLEKELKVEREKKIETKWETFSRWGDIEHEIKL